MQLNILVVLFSRRIVKVTLDAMENHIAEKQVSGVLVLGEPTNYCPVECCFD